jgi:hypothetical protein
MKLLLLTGGLLGFGIGLGIGLVREQSLPHALAHACVALYVGAMLMRWWGRVWVRALEKSRQEESRD